MPGTFFVANRRRFEQESIKSAPPEFLLKVIAFVRRQKEPELEGVPDWLAAAPHDDEPLTDEDKAALLEAEVEIKMGVAPIPGDEVFKRLLG